MVISVASGKGGTGKTTIAVSLDLSLPRVHILDYDEEEPNAHIFVKPSVDQVDPVFIPVPSIDRTICDFCGRYKEVCEYNAIAVLKKTCWSSLNYVTAAGRMCIFVRKGAIKEVAKEIGIIERGKRGDLLFTHGKLHIGQVMAPPGTSCPVIEAVKMSDFLLLVTEPTPFGLNDLVLAVEGKCRYRSAS